MEELEATKNLERTQSLEGWEIVDDIAGNRWLGHVESREGEWVAMDRCFPFTPLSASPLLIPQEVPASPLMGRGQQGPQMTMALTNVRSPQADAQLFLGSIILPRRVREAGSTRCADAPGWYREMLLVTIQGLEKDAHEIAVKARRAKMAAVEVRHGEESVSREKVK